jgi:hypothetical protein
MQQFPAYRNINTGAVDDFRVVFFCLLSEYTKLELVD